MNNSLFKFNFQIQTKIFFGYDSLFKLTPTNGSILLIVSSSLSDSIIKNLVSSWSISKNNIQIIKKHTGEPFSGEIDNIFLNLSFKPSAVVGIGGGSVLDCAKAIALLNESGGFITDYEFGKRKIDEVTPLFLAPTTCGSGSEVSPYIVINNNLTGRKFTLTDRKFQPKQAAIDPSFLSTLSPMIRVTTALDAFIHCLEARLNLKDSVVSAPFSEAGLRLGWKYLPYASNVTPSIEVLNYLSLISLYGGLSISQSRTGLVHTLSVAFAKYCDLPHGLLNAYLLPYALRHNLLGYSGELSKVITNCSAQQINSDEDALNTTISWLNNMVKINFPLSQKTILDKTKELVDRVLQDKGLASVSHSNVTEISLTKLIKEIAYAAR